MSQRKRSPRPGARLAPGRRGLVVLAGVLACGAGGLAAGPAAQAASHPGSAVTPGRPAANASSLLSGLSAVSAADVWAVGRSTVNNVAAPLVLRWNGTLWSKVPSPNPGGGSLSGVSAVSATDAWAAGTYTTGTTGKSLILHWNGTSWKQAASPSPGGTTGTTALYSVTAVSAAGAWAAGYYDTTPGGTEHALLLHWNGTSWTQVTLPVPASDYTFLEGVSADSAADAWAVGWESPQGGSARPLTLHWNGTSWTKVHSPNPGISGSDTTLRAVSAISATDAWATGSYTGRSGSGPASVSLILHWNGTSWKQVASPSPGGTSGYSTPYSVSADSTADAWAVGVYFTGGGNTQSLAAHWNGKSWTQVPSLRGGATGASLTGVVAISPADAWAAGYNGRSVILHWNGKSWTKVASPS